MSNYAPDPKNSNLYENLVQKTLENVTATDITKLTKPTRLSSDNQDNLIIYNLVNKAAMRDGRAIPETMVIEVGTTTDSGVGVDIFTPAKGEVWAVQSGTAVTTGISGNVSHILNWVDNTSSRSMRWYNLSAGNSTQILSDDVNWRGDKFIDSNITLQYVATGTFTNVVISILLYRIR